MRHWETEIAIPKAERVEVNEVELIVHLTDGRTISVPLDWYPRLKHGTTVEWSNWEPIGGGTGLHWPDLDEDIRIEALLAGRRSAEAAKSIKRWLASRALKE